MLPISDPSNVYALIEQLRREIRQLRNRTASISVGSGVVTSPGSPGSGTTTPLWTNASGASRDSGTVVIENGDRTFGVTTTAGNDKVIGVLVDDAIAVGDSGRVRHVGYVSQVAVVGTIAAGDYLKTSTTAGKAQLASGAELGAFALALTADSGGYVSAYVFPVLLTTSSFDISYIPFGSETLDGQAYTP